MEHGSNSPRNFGRDFFAFFDAAAKAWGALPSETKDSLVKAGSDLAASFSEVTAEPMAKLKPNAQN